MLLNDRDALQRLNSPSNLMNRLSGINISNSSNSSNSSNGSRANAMGLFGIGNNNGNGANRETPKENKPKFNNPFSSRSNADSSNSNGNNGGSVHAVLSDSTDLVRSDESKLDLARALSEAVEVVDNVAEETKDDSPSIDDLLGDVDGQISLATAHNTALQVVNATLRRITNDIDSIDSRRLPAILTSAQKVVDSVRKEKLDLQRQGDNKQIHYHFYTPTQKKLTDFAVIDVG